MKKLLTILLTIMMAFTTITFNVCAEDDLVKEDIDVNGPPAPEGLAISVDPDKTSYAVGETITVKVVNTGGNNKFDGDKDGVAKYTITVNNNAVSSLSIPSNKKSITGEYTLKTTDVDDAIVVKVVAANNAGPLSNKTAQTTIKVEAAKTAIDVPTAKTGLVYDKTEQTGVVEAEGYTLTGNKATAAGKHEATATLKSGYEWKTEPKDGDRKIEWTIEKATITSVTIKEGKAEYTKDGETKLGPDKDDLVVKAGELVLDKDDYDLSDNKSKDLGEHNLVVKAKAEGNYKNGTPTGLTAKYEIVDVKDTNTIDKKDVKLGVVKSATYNGKAQDVTVVGLEKVGHYETKGFGPFARREWVKDYTLKFKKDEAKPEEEWLDSITDAGKYKVKVIIDADSEYSFKQGPDKKEKEHVIEGKDEVFTINKAELTPSLMSKTSNYTGRTNNPTVLPFRAPFVVEYYKNEIKLKNKVNNCVEIGEYKVVVKLTEGAEKNYVLKGADKAGVVVLDYEITKVSASASLWREKVQWNGNNQMPVVNVSANRRTIDKRYYDVEVRLGIIPKFDIYGMPTDEAIEPGTYKVTVTLNSEGKKLYSFNGEDSIDLIYTIGKKEINVPWPQRLVYNGEAQEPFAELPEYLAYNLDFTDDLTNSEVNAGFYKVGLQITDGEHYEWARTNDEVASVLPKLVYWSIEKANLDQVQIYPGRPVALKGFHADCLINNIGMYEEGTKFEEYVWGEGWVELNVAENGLVLLNEGWHTIRAKADDNHNEVGRYFWTTVFVATSPVDYTLSGSAYKGDKKAVVTCDREDYDALSEVRIQIGDEVIVLGYDQYTVEKGSTKVTITDKNLVSTLAVGEYKVGFIYNDGMHVTGNLVIKNRPVTPYVAPKTGVE